MKVPIHKFVPPTFRRDENSKILYHITFRILNRTIILLTKVKFEPAKKKSYSIFVFATVHYSPCPSLCPLLSHTTSWLKLITVIEVGLLLLREKFVDLDLSFLVVNVLMLLLPSCTVPIKTLSLRIKWLQFKLLQCAFFSSSCYFSYSLHFKGNINLSFIVIVTGVFYNKEKHNMKKQSTAIRRLFDLDHR